MANRLTDTKEVVLSRKTKRRSSSNFYNNNYADVRRDVPTLIANPSRRRLPHIVLSSLVAASGEDHRVHLPKNAVRRLRNLASVPIRPVVRFRSVPRNFKVLRDVYRRGLSSRHLSFDFVLPRNAVVCARRKIRREVIFAKGRAGRRGQRRPRFNNRSNLICR